MQPIHLHNQIGFFHPVNLTCLISSQCQCNFSYVIPNPSDKATVNQEHFVKEISRVSLPLTQLKIIKDNHDKKILVLRMEKRNADSDS